MRFLEKERTNFDDALNMASRLKAFDIMGFAGPEGERNKSKFARAAICDKESTGSEGVKVSEEIVKPLADLKVLMSSYRLDLDRQQKEITMLRSSHQPSYFGNWNLSPDSHPTGVAWTGARSYFLESAQDHREPAWLGRGTVQEGGGHRVRG